MDTPKPPPPDPALVAQQEAAKVARGNQIQQGLSAETLNMLKMFGGGGLLTGQMQALRSPVAGLGMPNMPSLFGKVG